LRRNGKVRGSDSILVRAGIGARRLPLTSILSPRGEEDVYEGRGWRYLDHALG
jgi:hypothetical protein